MNTTLSKIFTYIVIILLVYSYSFSQIKNEPPDKVLTKSEDILLSIIKSHNQKKSTSSEITLVTTQIVENGYVLENRLGQYWNGTDWENSSLDLFTYSPQGLKIEEINQLWNNGVWENSRRFLTTYYLNELISLYEEQNWNGANWENSYQYESLYNTANQLSEYNVYQWNGTVWDNMSKTIYTYYPSGNLETIVDQQWDGTNWLNAYKYSYQYNTNNTVSERLTEVWLAGSWENSLKDVYSYNSQNLASLIASYWWSESLWKESVEIYYAYDTYGNVVDRLTKFWESEILGLQNKYHTTYEYLPATSLETKVENQDWDLQLMQWINTYRVVKIYNEENVLQNYLMDVWDGTAWLSTNQENYSYDENGNLDTLLEQYWSGTEWINTFRAFYTWTPITSVDSDNSITSPGTYSLEQNYPNPFNPSTTLSFTLPVEAQVTLKIYNSIGEEVSHLVSGNFTAGSHEINFDASNLVSGMYIYSIDAKGTDNSSYHSVKKMILLK